MEKYLKNSSHLFPMKNLLSCLRKLACFGCMFFLAISCVTPQPFVNKEFLPDLDLMALGKAYFIARKDVKTLRWFGPDSIALIGKDSSKKCEMVPLAILNLKDGKLQPVDDNLKQELLHKRTQVIEAHETMTSIEKTEESIVSCFLFSCCLFFFTEKDLTEGVNMLKSRIEGTIRSIEGDVECTFRQENYKMAVNFFGIFGKKSSKLTLKLGKSGEINLNFSGWLDHKKWVLSPEANLLLIEENAGKHRIIELDTGKISEELVLNWQYLTLFPSPDWNMVAFLRKIGKSSEICVQITRFDIPDSFLK